MNEFSHRSGGVLTVEKAEDKGRRKAGLGGSGAGEKQDSSDHWGYNSAAHRQG